MTRQGGLLYSINVVFHMYAALAQSVERRLGKAEVGGSIPLGSFESPWFTRAFFCKKSDIHLWVRRGGTPCRHF